MDNNWQICAHHVGMRLVRAVEGATSSTVSSADRSGRSRVIPVGATNDDGVGSEIVARESEVAGGE